MDPEQLEELAESLSRDGQFQAIALEERGVRYAIIAGHRRFVASKMRHLPDIRAEIYPAGVDHAVVIQAGENAYREKVNAGEEGEWLLDHYRNRCGEDLTRLVQLTGLPEDRVSRHLFIAMSDPKILAAVKEKKISASAAVELNRIRRADHRDYYLTHAIQTGASVRLIKLWRAQSEQMAAQDEAPPPTDAPAAARSEPAPAVVHMCACCGGTHDVHDMEYIQVHRYCNKAHLERLRKRLAGEGE
jgi:ParB/RepB/Spo0J family partition protein